MSSRYQELCKAKGARLQSLAGPTLDSLMYQPAFAELAARAKEGPIDPEQARPWFDRDLLHALLRGALLDRLPHEFVFTALRSAFLQRSLNGTLSEALAALRVSLALQCFANDHAWFESDADGSLLTSLSALVESGQADAQQLIVYAMFRPLAHLEPGLVRPLQDSSCAHIEELMHRAYHEPRLERQLQQQLETLGTVEDETSLRVQQQYETNPYPRWWAAPPANPRPLSQSLNAWYPQVDAWNEDQILIAGCGNGRHPIDFARNYPASRVVGVDLSRTSLACATRLAAKFELKNLRFVYADLLTLPDYPDWRDRFGLIDCFGVLHHLRDPGAGCRALGRLLVPGGVLRIALYSEVARADKGIDQARADCAEELSNPTAENLRKARRKLLDSKLIQYLDFHSLAGFRDLLAPAQEAVFTPSKAAQMMIDSGLTEVKLLGSAPLLQAFSEAFPGAAFDDWQAWDRFEQAHPYVFSQMFTFCGRRPG